MHTSCILLSGFWKHILSTGVGFQIGSVLANFKEERIRQREIVLFDYINTHPDDFVEPRKFDACMKARVLARI